MANFLTAITANVVDSLNLLNIKTGKYRGLRFVIYDESIPQSLINGGISGGIAAAQANIQDSIKAKIGSSVYPIDKLVGADKTKIYDPDLADGNYIKIAGTELVCKNSLGIYKNIGSNGSLIQDFGEAGAEIAFNIVLHGNNYQDRIKFLVSQMSDTNYIGSDKFTLVHPMYGLINKDTYFDNWSFIEGVGLHQGAIIRLEFKCEASASQLFQPPAPSNLTSAMAIINDVLSIANDISGVVIEVKAFSSVALSSNTHNKDPQVPAQYRNQENIAKSWQATNLAISDSANKLNALMNKQIPIRSLNFQTTVNPNINNYNAVINSLTQSQLKTEYTKVYDSMTNDIIAQITDLRYILPNDNNAMSIQKMYSVIPSYQQLVVDGSEFYKLSYGDNQFITTINPMSARNIIFNNGGDPDTVDGFIFINKIINPRRCAESVYAVL